MDNVEGENNMYLEKQKEYFKHHIASFADYGNIKIVDFKKPNSSVYRIRFLFEEDFYRLHISGDLGELVATNYKNMTFEGFSDFVNNPGYFEKKINCMSRTLYFYDENKARKDLDKLITENDAWDEFMEDRFDFETHEDVLNDILEDFDEKRGIGSNGYDELSKGIIDAWYYASDAGKTNTGILELYMLAFKLAMEQLKKTGDGE